MHDINYSEQYLSAIHLAASIYLLNFVINGNNLKVKTLFLIRSNRVQSAF